jgi:hypothetical protein
VFRYGDVVICDVRGQVAIVGLSGGRIPWPANALVLCGALAKAVSSLWPDLTPGIGDRTPLLSRYCIFRWRSAFSYFETISATLYDTFWCNHHVALRKQFTATTAAQPPLSGSLAIIWGSEATLWVTSRPRTISAVMLRQRRRDCPAGEGLIESAACSSGAGRCLGEVAEWPIAPLC